MLLVPTYVAPSQLHGLGLFAAAGIKQGAKIWEFTPGFDLEFSQEELAALAEPCRERILSYAYYNAGKLRYILCSDDARFINHSEQPNTVTLAGGDPMIAQMTIAGRDIIPGEELTEDYRRFEDRSRNIRYGLIAADSPPANASVKPA